MLCDDGDIISSNLRIYIYSHTHRAHDNFEKSSCRAEEEDNEKIQLDYWREVGVNI